MLCYRFAIELDQLLISLERQGLSEEVSSSVETVYYSKENRTKAIYANARRESGFDVELILLKSETELESKEKKIVTRQLRCFYNGEV